MSSIKKVWVYDLEQFANLHTATFMERDDPKNVRAFVIHKSRDHSKEYYRFLLEEVSGLIGFNNINYDYPLIHFFMAVMRSYQPDPDTLTSLLYEEGKRIIAAEFSSIRPNEVRIPQLDLYKIHHFDNKAKRTSLKAVEIAINFPNVQDIPFNEHTWILNDQINDVLGYNLNDVRATYEFYLLTANLVSLRKSLGKKYGINLNNHNDPKMGQEIFGREIAKKKEWSYYSLKDMRTYRHEINLKECMIDKIHFNSKEFKKLHDELYATTVSTTYKAFEKSVIYKGFKYDYGTGGIHGCIESGVYESDDDYIIYDIDVAAYYPKLAISNGFYPQHLGEDFVQVYSELYDARMVAKATGDKVTNSGLKLALNGVFGKSNDMYSLFYDPKYFLSITINGQLLLSMLAESLVDNVFDMTVLQINTDGITIKVKKTSMLTVKTVCEQWEESTGLVLEYAEYKKMVIRDVNNYLAQTFDGEAKPKGCFEIIPMMNGAIAYSKNWSMRVVPKAIHAYYLEGIPIEEFIRKHDNMYDFCLSFRAQSDWDVYFTYIAGQEKIKEKQQRTIRYYVSKHGGALTKEHKTDKRVISIESGQSCVMFNTFEEREEYHIDYNYYIAEANKIKNAVDDGQLKLF